MTTGAAADFDAFYAAGRGEVVAMAYALTGDLTEAQDLAQEVFCRAWQRWGQISRYDSPMAWTRRVVTNLATSRLRRLRTATAHLVRQRLPEVEPPQPAHVAIVAALRRLPVAQRRAVVLHHLCDLSVVEVAEHLDAPVGTVKSLLSRGRAAMARYLADEDVDDVAEEMVGRG